MNYYTKGMIEFTGDHNYKLSSPYSLHGNSTSRIDLSFEEVVRDIPGSIIEICQQFYPEQDGPSDAAMEAIKDYLKRDKKEKQVSQRRSLEDFHLTKNDVAFADYTDLFLS